MDKKIRILSIDGGGIRGILPGMILAALEDELKRQSKPDASISEYFDFVAGTSTGGILSCALLIPSEEDNRMPKFSAREAVKLYLDRGDEIFDVPIWKKAASLGGLRDEKYPEAELEEALKDYFGDVSLSQLLKPSLISAYNIRSADPFFFKSHYAKKKLEYDYRLTDVARGTSAAPTYFECARVKSYTGDVYPLIDGGVFVNNPALCAYSEVRTICFQELRDKYYKKHKRKDQCPEANDMIIVSLGTGSSNSYYSYKDVKNWGMIEWISPLINVMMSGVAETVDFQLKQMFQTTDNPEHYIRLEPSLENADSAMDNGSPENLERLRQAGDYNAKTRFKTQIEDIARLLIENN